MKDTLPYISKYATFSEDRTERYVLHRRWNSEKPCAMVIGLNPSNADEHEDDPTIGFVVRVLDYNGYGGLYMVNLFTMITPHPEKLVHDDNPLFAREIWMKYNFKTSNKIFAWGNFKTHGRNKIAKQIFQEALCFGHLKSGEPRHPMYMKPTTTLKKYFK